MQNRDRADPGPGQKVRIVRCSNARYEYHGMNKTGAGLATAMKEKGKATEIKWYVFGYCAVLGTVLLCVAVAWNLGG